MKFVVTIERDEDGMFVGEARIETPLQERRIGAIHRVAGPRGLHEAKWHSLDGFLLEQVGTTGLSLKVPRQSRAPDPEQSGGGT